MKNVILTILDGWGIGNKSKSDAIFAAKTPFFDSLLSQYPNSQLSTSGKDVGLPTGQMGNSEVGHLNLGAGRIVYQELAKINNAFENHDIENNVALANVVKYAELNRKPIHLLGLVSDGGVHSHINHVIELCKFLAPKTSQPIYIHAFTDGRDTDPKSGLGFLAELNNAIQNYSIKLATIVGRYFAMDRDKRWERVALAYNLLINSEGAYFDSFEKAIHAAYEANITDEFIMPIVLTENDKPIAKLKPNDAVICFNFRTDRCREIVSVLTQTEFPEFNMKPINLHLTTFTEYDKSFENVNIVFSKEDVNQTLGEVLQNANKTQIRIAETEKYPHVTFFYSGGRESPFTGESRILIPSPKDVPTYDLKPEMSAYGITEAILPELLNKSANFICLNFANPDMVGHTGDFEAVVKAIETVDYCLQQVVTTALESDYEILILADHGNADFMINPDGTPNTAHSLNQVPFILVSNTFKGKLKNGILGNVAPTILELMNIEKPEVMTCDSLLETPITT